jgi:predicted HTH domain antitoxin
MATIQVEVPDETFVSVRRSPEEVATEMKVSIAVHWYELGVISQGTAAAIAGMSRAAFIDALGTYGVSACEETVEDIREVLQRG